MCAHACVWRECVCVCAYVYLSFLLCKYVRLIFLNVNLENWTINNSLGWIGIGIEEEESKNRIARCLGKVSFCVFRQRYHCLVETGHKIVT